MSNNFTKQISRTRIAALALVLEHFLGIEKSDLYMNGKAQSHGLQALPDLFAPRDRSSAFKVGKPWTMDSSLSGPNTNYKPQAVIRCYGR